MSRAKIILHWALQLTKNNGDNFDVAVDTKTSIRRDFDEVNKILKKKVRNT